MLLKTKSDRKSAAKKVIRRLEMNKWKESQFFYFIDKATKVIMLYYALLSGTFVLLVMSMERHLSHSFIEENINDITYLPTK